MIKVGDKFRCIKDLRYREQYLWYKKGRIYQSDEDGCITDEEGDTGHVWPTDRQYERDCFLEYFIPYVSNKRKGYGK
jgi:hypothetical protein